jgi:hypothetical protein
MVKSIAMKINLHGFMEMVVYYGIKMENSIDFMGLQRFG